MSLIDRVKAELASQEKLVSLLDYDLKIADLRDLLEDVLAELQKRP